MSNVQTVLTGICRQVLEVHGLADLPVRRPPQLHFHWDGDAEVSAAVWRRAEHDGHLPVYVRLREGALALPGVAEEAHLDILCMQTGGV